MVVEEEATTATPASPTSTKKEEETYNSFLQYLKEAPTATTDTTTTADTEKNESVDVSKPITTIVDVEEEEQPHPSDDETVKKEPVDVAEPVVVEEEEQPHSSDDSDDKTEKNESIDVVETVVVEGKEQPHSSDDIDDIPEKKEEEEEQSDNKLCSCYNWMHFTSVALFLIGSIFYLVLAVDDFRWAHTLLGLPMRLRMSSSSSSPNDDDDLVWMQYRLEERYQEYLSTMMTTNTTPAVGVRRRMMMKRERRLMLEEEEGIGGAEEIRLQLLHEIGTVRLTSIEASSDYDTTTTATLEALSTAKAMNSYPMMLRKLQQTPAELWYDLAWAELPEEI
jgi:hypothetical protein